MPYYLRYLRRNLSPTDGGGGGISTADMDAGIDLDDDAFDNPTGGQAASEPSGNTNPNNSNTEDEPLKKEGEEEEEEEEEGKEGKEGEGDEEGEGDLLDEIIQATGYVFEDKEYERSPVGVANYIQDVTTKVINDAWAELNQEHPDAIEYIRAKEAGRVQEWLAARSTDVTLMDVSEDDIEGNARIVLNDFIAKGFDKDSAQGIVDALKASNTLVNTAKSVVETARANKAIADATAREQAIKEEKATQDRLRAAHAAVIEGKSEFVVPVADRKAFADARYLINPETGMTGVWTAFDKLDEATKQKIEYLIIKGGKVDELVEARAKSVNTAKKHGKFNFGKSGNTADKNKYTSGSESDLDDDDLMPPVTN